MINERENSVPGESQLTRDARLRGQGDGHPRILFLGNSITLHGPKVDIGWSGDWGMAASCLENDYVHVFMDNVRKRRPDASYRIGQLADWEREFWRGEDVLNDFAALRDWQPDLILCVILGANTPEGALKEHDFSEHYRRMMRYFDPESKAQIIATTLFWGNEEKDDAIRSAAKAEHATLIEMNDLGAMHEMMAIDKFHHRGVAIHPGDAGMREIARRLLDAYRACSKFSVKEHRL